MARTALQKCFAPAKKLLPKAIWSPIRALATAVITPIRFSTKTGHWKSGLQTSARGADGSPLPWYTYPAIDFLAQRDFNARNVLEFGGGQSTDWWSARARSVLTIEEDRDWFESLCGDVGGNVSLHYVPADAETRNIAPVNSRSGCQSGCEVRRHCRRRSSPLRTDELGFRLICTGRRHHYR